MINMKKQLVYIIATLVLLLSACADEGEKETTFKENEDPATTENVANDEDAATDEESEDETEDEFEEIAEEEVVENLYELDANWSFQADRRSNPEGSSFDN